jgi:hypothetical protein
MADTSGLSAELNRLRDNGLVLPRHQGRAASMYAEAIGNARSMSRTAGEDLDRASMRLGRPITNANYDTPEVQRIIGENRALTRAMGSKRGLGMRSAGMNRESAMQRHDRLYPKLAGTGSAGGGDVMNAIPRFYDPLEYWDLSGLPWNVQDEGHRHKLHKWLRLYYATHYLVPILVDIFTRFPLVGMELECKDPKIKEFYEDLFFDQLDYGEFLVALGREFWVVGEAFPLGSFDEDLGVWEREELINPEDVVIENFPMLGSQQLKIVPPDYLKRLAQLKQPAREYRLLEMNFPDLIPFLLKGEHIPISGVLLKQIGNKLNNWDDRGTPILLRGLRTLLHEEKLLASQDAVAERLYSPLILAKLGIQDMGDGLPPFIPGPEELDEVRDQMDMALSSDFRLLVHHFGLEVSNVFGREQMPRLGDDFDRIEKRLMQVFGVNPSLLSAGSGGQPYASSALQAEFLNQILKTFQNTLIKHFQSRAAVVAEAQKHYAYETKGKTRIPIYETIVEYDMDGTKRLKEVPKLLIPDMTFQTLDLRDEATEREFLQSLRGMGVPIPDQDLMVGIRWKIKDKIAAYNEELKQKTIYQQQAKMDTYMALTAKNLPIPLDLRTEVESVLQTGQGAQGAAGPSAPGMEMPPGGAPGEMGPPGGGLTPGVSAPGITPGAPGQGIVMPAAPGASVPGGGPPAAQAMPPGPRGNVPEVSNERRPGLTYNTSVAPTARDRTRRRDLRTAMNVVLSEDIANENFELGVPFEDFVADQEGSEYDYERLNALNEDEVAGYVEKWPAHQAEYRQAVTDEVVWRFADLQDDQEVAILEDEDEKPLVLARFQELQEVATDDGKTEERIVEKRAKKRIVQQLPEGKKYSIVDPEAVVPEVDTDKDEHESEPTGQRTVSESSDSTDSRGVH